MSRSKNVLINTVWEIGVYVIVILIGFFAPRFIILTYGSEVNGLSSTITQILNVILLLQSGATTAAIYSLYKPIAEKDYNLIGEKLAAAEAFFRKIAVLFTLLMIVVSVISAFVLKSGLSRWMILIAFLIMGMKSALDLYYTSKFRIVFTAFQKKYLISASLFIEQLIYYALVFLNLFLRWPFILMYVWLLLGCGIKVLFLHRQFEKQYGSLIPRVKGAGSEDIQDRGYSLANEVSHSVVNSSITIILSFLYGLEETSVYAVYALVDSALNLMLSAIYSAFGPSFGDLVAGEDQTYTARVFRMFQFMYLIFNTFLYMCMLYLIVPFVKIYTAGATDANYVSFSLAILMALLGSFSAYRIPYNIIVSSCGYFKETWKQPVICAALALILSCAFGSIAFPLVLVGPIFFYVSNFLYQYFRLKKLCPYLIFPRTFLLLAVTLVGVALAAAAGYFMPVGEGILRWIFGALVFALFAAAYLFLTCLLTSRKDLKDSVRYVRSVIRKLVP